MNIFGQSTIFFSCFCRVMANEYNLTISKFVQFPIKSIIWRLMLVQNQTPTKIDTCILWIAWYSDVMYNVLPVTSLPVYNNKNNLQIYMYLYRLISCNWAAWLVTCKAQCVCDEGSNCVIEHGKSLTFKKITDPIHWREINWCIHSRLSIWQLVRCSYHCGAIFLPPSECCSMFII